MKTIFFRNFDSESLNEGLGGKQSWEEPKTSNRIDSTTIEI